MPRNRNRTDPGQLRHKLVIERRQAGQDALGQPVEVWEQVATIWAAMLPTSKGDEQVLAGRPVEAGLVHFRLRAQDAAQIQPGDCAVFNGRVLNFLATPPVLRVQWVDVVAGH